LRVWTDVLTTCDRDARAHGSSAGVWRFGVPSGAEQHGGLRRRLDPRSHALHAASASHRDPYAGLQPRNRARATRGRRRRGRPALAGPRRSLRSGLIRFIHQTGGLIMAVPKKKTSSARRDQRRAHHALAGPRLVTCPNCGQPHVPHRVCRECGYYKGRTAVAVEGTE
jgi:large subunit ribosomal protein L32